MCMKGEVPAASDGIVSATGCINNGRECCVSELPIQVRNCSSSQGVDSRGDGIVVYHLGPTPECNMGYCAGEGLPCPNGLSSKNGYTPCNFPVKLKSASISTSVTYSLSKGHDVVMLHCNPIIEGIRDPSTVMVDVKWWVLEDNEDKTSTELRDEDANKSRKTNIFEESYRLSSKTFSTLNRQYWKVGDTVQCSAVARHETIGSSTKEVESSPFFLGLKVITSSELSIKEGGRPAPIKIKSTIPITCLRSSSTSHSQCCLDLQVIVKNEESGNSMTSKNQIAKKQCTKYIQPFGGNVFARAKDGSCMAKLCSDKWNQTQGFEVIAPTQISNPGFGIIQPSQYSAVVNFKILQNAKTPVTNLKEWINQRLPSQNVNVIGAGNSGSANKEEPFCEIASPTNSIMTFDGLKYNIAFAGTYTLFRHKTLPYEIQANVRACNIRNMCICALVVRSQDTAVTFDVCTKGYMRVWAKSLHSSDMKNDHKIQEEFLGLKGLKESKHVLDNITKDGIEVLSIDDGRNYKVTLGRKPNLSSSIEVSIGPLLTYVKITASYQNIYNTLGLCGTFDGNIRNEFMAMKTSATNNRIDSSTSRTTQVIEPVCNDQPKKSSSKSPCKSFFNAWSLHPSRNLFTGHVNVTSIHSKDNKIQIKRQEIPEGFCHCTNEHLGKDNCKEDSIVQEINIEDINSQNCISEDEESRGVSVLPDLLSFGKNKDFDPNASLLVSKLDEEDKNDATLKLLEASLNNKSISATGSPGRIGEIASTADNVINNEDVDTRIIFPDIDIGDSGSSVRVPSKGRLQNSGGSSLCEDILRNSGPSFTLCQNFVDVNRYVQDCRLDLLFSGNAGTASLHLKHLKEDCLDNISLRTDDDQNIIQKDPNIFNGRFVDARRGRGVSLSSTPQTTSRTLISVSSVADSLCLHDCSGNGKCDSGNCKCEEGFFGVDCSVEIRPGKDGSPSRISLPRTSSLANYGLCNVRTKPCRDIVVLGDGFVDHPSLTCIYETYKIRGVASKQIVKDTIETTAKAKFISHGQVMCPLPAFEIHRSGSSNDEVIVNLKDNTDHTRLFVKLSLAYIPKNTPKTTKSAPLDLLLYDDLCWDCESSGKCNIRPKTQKTSNLCYFASANSLVEVFRIGKTISTKIAGSGDTSSECSLPKDGGGCDNKIFRYYYNAIEKRCKIFIYGGCKGNRNNFLSEAQCLQRCDSDSNLALKTAEIDTCSQKRDAGICPGNVPRFYFDKKLGSCRLFTYGGCGGNSNNFASLDDCVANCGGPAKHAGIGAGSSKQGGVIRPRNAICSLSISKGTCKATLRRFYFDMRTGTCKLFIFGGCQGNANNFETMESCIKSCIGLESSEMHGFRDDQDSRENQNSLSTFEQFNQETSVSVCKLPKDFGTCLTVSIRFYHDYEAGSCKKFRYSGCGGNGNNFLSGEACVRTCGGLVDIERRLPKLPTIDLAPNPPTGHGERGNVVSSLPALSSTPNAGSGVSIVAITPRTPRSTTTTSTTTIGIASTERPIFNVNTILPNVIDDSREIKEEPRSQPLIQRSKQPNTVRVRQRKVRVRQRKRPIQDTTEKTEEEPTTEAATTTTKTRNLSSRIGQWNSKDTRTRLRQVAEKRLRANALKSKLAATSAPSKRTTLASTTVVQSRGEEGLIGEGSEPEHTQIRTQTSRSIVMRRSRIKQQQEEFKKSHNSAKEVNSSIELEIEPTSPAALRRTAQLFDTFSSRRPSRRVISVLGNITRATPTGVTRFPGSHRLAQKNTENSIKEINDPEEKISTTTTKTPPTKLLRTRPFSPSFRHKSRIKSLSLSSLPNKKVSSSSRKVSHQLSSSTKSSSNSTSHSVLPSNKSISPQTTTPKIILRGTRKKSRQKIRGGRISEVGFASETSVSEEAAVIGPSGKRIGQVDQVVKAPERFNGSSALVVIRSFCRFAPLESDAPHCRKPEPLYFYNVTSAACEPFYGGHCQRSRNRFRNVPDCLKSCVVSARGFTTAPLDVSDRSIFASRGRGESDTLSSSLDNSRLNALNVARQRVRGLIRNFTGPGKNKPKPATVTEN